MKCCLQSPLYLAFFCFTLLQSIERGVKGSFTLRVRVGGTAKQLVVVAEQQSMVDIGQLASFDSHYICKAAYAAPLAHCSNQSGACDHGRNEEEVEGIRYTDRLACQYFFA